MPEIGVVHLVRRANGIAPFERFLQSYRAHPAGAGHELLLLFKGFGVTPPPEYQRLLAGLSYRALTLPDRGFDLGPYFRAAAHFEHRYFCFFNSFSRILAPDWLAKLSAPLAARGVGVVSATGSYQSFAAGHAERGREFAGMGLAARLASRLRHVAGDPTFAGRAQRAGAWLLGAAGLWDPARHFPAFPNYHVRTNAFIASRDTLAAIRLRPIFFKLSAFALESGKNGLTAQIARAGLAALVVGRGGESFAQEQWHLSNTYRQARQEGLLVADNQTEAYERADAETRAILCRQAWGEFARPA